MLHIDIIVQPLHSSVVQLRGQHVQDSCYLGIFVEDVLAHNRSGIIWREKAFVVLKYDHIILDKLSISGEDIKNLYLVTASCFILQADVDGFGRLEMESIFFGKTRIPIRTGVVLWFSAEYKLRSHSG